MWNALPVNRCQWSRRCYCRPVLWHRLVRHSNSNRRPVKSGQIGRHCPTSAPVRSANRNRRRSSAAGSSQLNKVPLRESESSKTRTWLRLSSSQPVVHPSFQACDLNTSFTRISSMPRYGTIQIHQPYSSSIDHLLTQGCSIHTTSSSSIWLCNKCNIHLLNDLCILLAHDLVYFRTHVVRMSSLQTDVEPLEASFNCDVRGAMRKTTWPESIKFWLYLYKYVW